MIFLSAVTILLQFSHRLPHPTPLQRPVEPSPVVAVPLKRRSGDPALSLGALGGFENCSAHYNGPHPALVRTLPDSVFDSPSSSRLLPILLHSTWTFIITRAVLIPPFAYPRIANVCPLTFHIPLSLSPSFVFFDTRCLCPPSSERSSSCHSPPVLLSLPKSLPSTYLA